MQINDDHTSENFESLKKHFSYGCVKHGKLSLIVGTFVDADEVIVRILDGVHRAAILSHSGFQEIEMIIVTTQPC